jgi:hypothetical protein
MGWDGMGWDGMGWDGMGPLKNLVFTISGAERGDRAWTTRLGRRILFDCSGAVGTWYSAQEHRNEHCTRFLGRNCENTTKLRRGRRT